MQRFEEKIRDFLSENLNILERGLRLIKNEFPLANARGAGGFVDILATDELGHYVIIEIKRSNQAARQALHELTKYIALIKSEQGVRADRIRAVLVSTEWHELRVPFSEYLKVCEVPTEGYEITAAEDGRISSVAKFQPLEVSSPLRLSRAQDILLFHNKSDRDKGLNATITGAIKAGINDFVILNIDYAGGDARVIFPFALYLAFSSPFANMPQAAIEEMKELIEWEDLDEPDENFLINFRNHLNLECGDSEIGYPEKLSQMLMSGWQVSSMSRHGRYLSNTLIMPNEQVIREARYIEGGAGYYIYQTASPKYQPSWAALKEHASLVVAGNSEWADILASLFAEVESGNPLATVSLSLYNPTDTPFSLWRYFRDKDNSYLPSFQLVISGADSFSICSGYLVWNRCALKISAQDWINSAYSSIDYYFCMRHFHETYERDDLARSYLGITSRVTEYTRKEDGESISALSSKEESVVRTDISTISDASMEDFYTANYAFGSDLCALFARWVCE